MKPNSLCDGCIREKCEWRTPTGVLPPVMGCESFIRKPQTNADRIRAMSDEELAIWLADREIKAYTKLGYWGTPEVVRAKYLDWLKSPAADDG